jgi:peptidoglycan LD-endopeptidase LytH
LSPIKHDRSGEATDDIFAVLPGVVRHISRVAGHSSYGRYIVLEHPGQVPAIYTLYAHLGALAPGLEAGGVVAQGQTIATMGRSAGGYTIPKDRAHLHFEMGVRLTDDFQRWYDWRKFGSRNEHGLWNGMNLVGFDPLEFYNRFRDRRINNLNDFFAQQEWALRVRVAGSRVPDFVTRYPSLLTRPAVPGAVAGWEVQITAFGVPFAWTPLSADELVGYRPNEVRVVAVDEDRLATCRCRNWVSRRGGAYTPARDLQTLLQLLFGLRT